MTELIAKRLILFAGFSDTGDIPLPDLLLLKELSRFGEVHAYYDNDDIVAQSAAQTTLFVRDLTFEKHNEYDFGSWKRLIEHLGEQVLQDFDELILVNDSVILLGSLDSFFDALTDSAAVFFSPIFLDEDYPGQELLVKDFLDQHPYDVNSSMFASFFWSMKKELFTHYVFKQFVGSIEPQSSRVVFSHSYERGFSRSILRHGFPYVTHVEKVYPYSSVYTENAFLLAAHGLPFIKKKALAPVFYTIRYLDQRIEMLRSVVSTDFAPGLDDFVARAKSKLRRRRGTR